MRLSFARAKAAAATALVAVYALGAEMRTWVLAAVITALLVLLCGVERVGPHTVDSAI